MKQIVSKEAFNEGLAKLLTEYDIYGPVRHPYRGTHSDTDKIQYQQVHSFDEMEWDEKSQFHLNRRCSPLTNCYFIL